MSHLNMLIAYEKRIFQQGDPLRECFIFVCSMIGLIARNIKQLNKYVVNRKGYQTFTESLN